jgi:cystathionine beta-lyase/cystathionine gamma-synthase
MIKLLQYRAAYLFISQEHDIIETVRRGTGKAVSFSLKRMKKKLFLMVNSIQLLNFE